MLRLWTLNHAASWHLRHYEMAGSWRMQLCMCTLCEMSEEFLSHQMGAVAEGASHIN